MAKSRPKFRFGIGEWFGKSFVNLTDAKRKKFADAGERRPPCPFLSNERQTVPCWKIGGVCTLRSYQEFDGVVGIDESRPSFRVTCPSRFEEDREIYRWICEVLLDDPDAVPIGQVNFLERVALMGSETEVGEGEGVGRIDNVLIVPGSKPLEWCPVEIQAVYFSGDKMENDFAAIRVFEDEGIPFPAGRRRPDYRSSGPKRLMPQLQIKVPTLRRWGKKMAVVVDEDFIKNMGKMETVNDISNCDVAWFVVRFDESTGKPMLARGDVHYTQLEAAVQGLIAGKPVTQKKFEERISVKLKNLGSGPAEIPADE